MKKYVREFIARFRKSSIEKKLKWLRMVVIIPALVGIITLLVIMINFNESYNEAVKNDHDEIERFIINNRYE